MMGLFFHDTWSPREGLLGERRHPALLLEAARAMKQREGRSNDVSDDNSESECPHVSERDTECSPEAAMLLEHLREPKEEHLRERTGAERTVTPPVRRLRE